MTLDGVDDATLDQLPFGVVALAPDGRVERYNRAEAERARVQRWRALGRDYFRDLAGPGGEELASRVRQLPPGERVRLRHTFRGFHRAEDTEIEAVRSGAGRLYLCIRSARAA